MDLKAPSFLPFERRDAYEPSDPEAYLMLQQLHCVRSEDGQPKPKDPLCSLCREVLLGEPLLDNHTNETEYRIVLYELPCGHLRCCSCALKWLDTAGIFHQICQFCDSQKSNIKPDLSFILDSIDTYGEPSLPGFDKIKRPKTPPTTEYSPIRLPTIEEVKNSKVAGTPSELDLGSLELQTPAAKRSRVGRQAPKTSNTEPLGSPTLEATAAKRRKSDHRGVYSSHIDLLGTRAPDGFQWTPKAQRIEDIIDAFENQIIPEELNSPAVMQAKKDRLQSWAARGKRKSDGLFNVGEDGEDGLTFEEFLEEEKQIRKKPRYAR